MAKKSADTQEAPKPEELLETFLNENSEDHFNFEPDYSEHCIVSSGSLLLDVAMGGGLRPSILRSAGVTEGGKTSNGLGFMLDFLKDKKKRRGLYIKAEGRLSKEVQQRSGVPFVFNAEDWKDGTCFVFKSNIYETIVSLLNKLINNNTDDYKYFIMIDAMDSLLSKVDKHKTPDENNKVAATAALSTDFLRRYSLVLSSRGHFCVLISQVRSNVKLNPYEKGDPRITNASGGNALLHYSDWILEFQPRFQDDYIWAGEKGKSGRLGHYCKITFRKSSNEATGKTIEYPIRYGRTGGNSVWVEYEVFDYLEQNEWIKVDKAWITPGPELIKAVSDGGFPVLPEKINGKTKFLTYLEDNPQLVQYLFEKFRSTLSKAQSA